MAGHGGGGFGGDSTNIKVGPFAVIGVMVMVVGMLVMPFRYPIVTLKVMGVSAVLAIIMASLDKEPTTNVFAPFLLLIAYVLSKGKR